MADGALRAVVVATRAPYPAHSGGSATLHALLGALPAAGVDVRVVALRAASADPVGQPYPLRTIEVSPRSWPAAALTAPTGTPLLVARYRLEQLATALATELATFTPDVVHLEQLHLAWLLPRLARRVPTILREQNVESLLLARVARFLPPPLRWLALVESWRTRRFERRACESATVVAAISEPDAAALRTLAPRGVVRTLPAAFAIRRGNPQALPGSPPFLCIGSFDWLPNRDGARWLVREVWPHLRRIVPEGVLHLAGPGSSSLVSSGSQAIVGHGQVPSATSLYDPAAVVLIPLRAGSGVRMRLIEAWAAGVPAAASTCAAEGLVSAQGDGALLASTALEFAEVAARLAVDRPLRAGLVERGFAKLANHDGARVAECARELYLEALARAPYREARRAR